MKLLLVVEASAATRLVSRDSDELQETVNGCVVFSTQGSGQVGNAGIGPEGQDLAQRRVSKTRKLSGSPKLRSHVVIRVDGPNGLGQVQPFKTR